jgi:hypothetical protein
MPTRQGSVYVLCVYVPVTHVAQVKAAVFAAGAGRIGKYDCCAWETKGVGQFRPLPGSHAFVGTVNAVEQVEEYKLEMVCAGDCLKPVIAALRSAHPYETPAFQYWKVATE